MGLVERSFGDGAPLVRGCPGQSTSGACGLRPVAASNHDKPVIPLPIDAHLSECLAAVRTRQTLVLTAAPGTGKSTRVPPALVEALPGTVLLLQPRRVAARALARRIASERVWSVGREVGWQVRFERMGTDATRLWVLTEGVLARRLRSDPYLDGVSAVVLDEFHERSIHTDLCLAWLAELRRTVRPDLAVVVMSATMNPAPVAKFLTSAPVLTVDAPAYPIETKYLPGNVQDRLEYRVADAVQQALRAPDPGDVLVFLPGTGEIRNAQRALEPLAQDGIAVLPLHGQLPPDEQDRALTPDPDGRTRVVLATNVAETSLTIPGVRTVIDSGLARVSRFDAEAGIDGLALERISRASADQRRGRAGRTASGRCYRLWSQGEDARLDAATDPEIERVDIAPVALALKAWHGPDTRTFPWFSPPDPRRLQAAEELIALLGACAEPYAALNERGQRMADLPCHPRLARLLLDADAAGQPRLGASLAALTGERDLRPPHRRGDPPADPAAADALDRLERLHAAEAANFHPALRDRTIDPIAAREAARVRDDLLGLVRGRKDPGTAVAPDPRLVCRLLLAAFPDRVGRRAGPNANRGVLTGGLAVDLDPGSCLFAERGQRRSDLFVACVVQGLGDRARTTLSAANVVRQGAEIDEDDLDAVIPGRRRREQRLRYDDSLGRVEASAGWYFGDLLLRSGNDSQADAEAIAACLAQALRPRAAALFAADEAAAGFLQRLRWLAIVRPDLGLTTIDDAALAGIIDQLCAGCRSRAEVEAKPKLPWLEGQLDHAQRVALDRDAPATLEVPSGSQIRLDYAQADPTHPPVLAVRLQELFGLAATPTLAGGRVPVLLHLLGPNFRPEQITKDLASFWANTYPQVRKDLRGRYPKHSWPDDPLTARPEAKGRRRQP